MKKITLVIILISPLFLSGYVSAPPNTGKRMLLCMRTVSKVTDLNKRNLASISLGMTKEDVQSVMGTSSVVARQLGERIEINNPYRTETLKGKERVKEIIKEEVNAKEEKKEVEKVKERKFEVWYYVTEMYGQDYRITDSKLTPFTFEENKLIGLGWNFLKDAIQKYDIKSQSN